MLINNIHLIIFIVIQLGFIFSLLTSKYQIWKSLKYASFLLLIPAVVYIFGNSLVELCIGIILLFLSFFLFSFNLQFVYCTKSNFYEVIKNACLFLLLFLFLLLDNGHHLIPVIFYIFCIETFMLYFLNQKSPYRFFFFANYFLYFFAIILLIFFY